MIRNRRAQSGLVATLIGATLVLACSAQAEDMAARRHPSPTAITVTNKIGSPVYVNLVLGQPPTTLPANCTNLGRQIKAVTDKDLAFTSNIPKKKVAFTTFGAKDKGYYLLSPHETITYRPKTFACADGACSPAVTFNFFFTAKPYKGTPNNGCGGSKTFPSATNLAEASVNFGINGAVGPGCANADATDISAVNGINAALELDLTGNGWPFNHAANGYFGQNANRPGTFGWAATNCTDNAGYPNPRAGCAAPNNAPRASSNGTCQTPLGTRYAAIVDPTTGIQYCDERSDASMNQCLSQRPGGVTGGTAAITFKGFMGPM